MEADVDAASIIGAMGLNNGSTVWIDGIVTTAARNGGILMVDEINIARPNILTALYALLDSGKLTLLDNGGEVVKVHPDFRFVVTQNPASDPMFRGVEDSSRALIDRMDVYIRAAYPTRAVEARILKDRVEGVSEDTIGRTLNVGSKIRNMVKDGQFDQPFTVRTSMRWAEMIVDGFAPAEAYGMAFMDRLEAYQRDRAEEVFEMIFETEAVPPFPGEDEDGDEDGETISPTDSFGKRAVGDISVNMSSGVISGLTTNSTY